MPTARTQRTKLIPLGGSKTYVDLVRDAFSTDAAAGFTSPRNSEPGPGKLVRTTDTSSRVSLDAGDLWINGAAASSYVNPAYYWTDSANASIARAAGLTLIYRVIGSGVVNIGWTTNTTIGNGTLVGFLLNTTTFSYTLLGTTVSLGSMSSLATYLLALTLRTSGVELRIKGGDFTQWSTMFVETVWTTSPLWPGFGIAGTVNARLPDLYLRQPLSGVLVSGTETLTVNSPDTTIRAASADVVAQVQGVVPTGAAGRKLELRYRQLDADNYMLVRVQWNGSNYEIVTGHVIAGVETLQGSPVTNVTFATNTCRIQVRAAGNNHDFYQTTSSSWNERYGTISDSSGASNTGVSVNNDGFTSTVLRTWAYQDASVAAALDGLAS